MPLPGTPEFKVTEKDQGVGHRKRPGSASYRAAGQRMIQLAARAMPLPVTPEFKVTEKDQGGGYTKRPDGAS